MSLASSSSATFATIANAPSVAGGELRDAPPQLMACLSAESLSGITGEVLAHNMGFTSDDSHACVIEFSLTHAHYVELVRTASADPTALTPEEYLELGRVHTKRSASKMSANEMNPKEDHIELLKT